MNHKALFLVLFACTIIGAYSQNLQLDQLYDLSNENFEKGLYKEAYDLSSKYIRISEQTGIKENPNFSDALMTKAFCIIILDNDINDFDTLSIKALDFERNSNGRSEYYRELLENRSDGFLFFLRRNLNNIDNINTCLQLINADYISCFGDSISKQLANVLSKISLYKEILFPLYNKIVTSYSEDKYESSYVLAQDLKNLLEEISLIDNSLYAECLQIIGLSSYMINANIDEAKYYLERAIRIEGLHGIYYYWYIQCYGDVCFKESLTKNHIESVPILRQAINAYSQIPFKDEIPEYIYALNNLCNNTINQYEAAAAGEEALRLKRKHELGDTLITISNLCEVYRNLDDYDKAEKYGRIVLNYRENESVIDSVKLGTIYERMASIYSRLNKQSMAIELTLKWKQISSSLFGINSSNYSRVLNNLGAYYWKTGDFQNAENNLLESYTINPSVDNTFNLIGLYANLHEINRCEKYLLEHRRLALGHILTEYFSIYSPIDRFAYLNRQDTYYNLYFPILLWNINAIPTGPELAYETILQNREAMFNNIENLECLKAINIDSVKAHLSEREVAIEFWSNRDYYNADNRILGVAIKKNWKKPRLIELSRDSVYKTLRAEIPKTKDFLPLYEHIWKPILTEIEISDGDTLYMALDDILTQYPIENICGYDSIYMGDKYTIRRVSDTSKIHTLKSRQSADLMSAVLYGGAQFSIHTSDFILNNTSFSTPDIRNFSGRKEIFDDLPWSVIEVDTAFSLLRSCVPSERICTLKGRACTESSVKQLSKNSPSILHFATHGFNTSSDYETDNDISYGYNRYLYTMEHTGLVLSSEDNEDGLLTASEISQLELSHTDLVVLSICNSGIGNFSAINICSELIFAFKKAGVQTIIMTLSKVDDAATSLFMRNFYKALSDGQTKYNAFRYAQSVLRNSEEFSRFTYWAYFAIID